MNENWKPCVGYPKYEVSDLGNVRSLDTTKWNGPAGHAPHKGRILKAAIGSHGYPYVQVGKGNVRTIHSLLLEAHVGPRPEGMESRHLDGDKQNCRLDNLCWGTPKQNGKDKSRHGTAKSGAQKSAATRERRTRMAGWHSMDEMTRAGCTTRRGIRHWESLGLLGMVDRSDGDTRRYTDEQLDKAKIIAAAAFGGWSLEEISPMLAEWGPDVHEAILTRLADQAMAAARLGENLPTPPSVSDAKEYDL